MSKNKVKVGISIGDLNGIGCEIILKSLADARILDFMIPVIYASSKVIHFHRKANKIGDLTFQKVEEGKDLKAKQIYIKECWNEDVKLNLGTASHDSGKYAIQSLKAASQDLANRFIDVLVTAPIDKNNVQSPEFNFPGHTEFLAKMANVEDALMFMVSDRLKVAVVTGHVPLKDVVQHLTKEKILSKIEQVNKSLIKDFGIVKPRIAVLGINPHAGDKGTIGEEDGNIVTPAVRSAFNKGIMAFGPYPADGFFGNGLFKSFDAVLAMYHDQGLTPFKTITFGNGVNYTAGLPIVRTSPDHGTAFDIAGKGEASEQSFRNALFKAIEIHKNRLKYKEMTENPLEPQKAGR